MESSPLVRAHEHARAASVATRQSSDTTVAINEHTQAAGEFASAAQATSSVEALRMLKLLENHHRKLAALLNLPPAPHQSSGNPSSQHSEGGSVSEKNHARQEEDANDDALHSKEGAAAAASSTASSPKTGQKPSSKPQQRRIASREMSSSIASNLASARGIRSKYRGQPLSPSMSNDQAPGNLDAHPRRDGSRNKMQTIIDQQTGKPTWVPPMPSSPTRTSDGQSKRRTAPSSSPAPEDPVAPPDDGGYTRFYNTFGSFINRISAPLAFAGLPLIQEESTVAEEAAPPQPAEPSQSKGRKQPVQQAPPTSHDADLSKIYSKATMRALAGEGFSAGESFYVVPTSGHTISYANILSYAEKEKRRLGASNHSALSHGPEDENNDDFVDARESPVPLSPGAKRRAGRARNERELNNTIEELHTENKSLKDMLDKLTKRLHTFEASAQNMAESYRLMRPGSPLSTTESAGGSAARASNSRSGERKERHAEMEEEYAAMRNHVEKLERDNKKMQKTLEKYREKWDTLKAGAKARREAQMSGDSVEDARAS